MLRIIIGLMVIILLCFFHNDTHAQRTDCCSRRAIISGCTFNDPMGIIGSHDNYCRSVKTRLAELFRVEGQVNCFLVTRPGYIELNRKIAKEQGWEHLLKPGIPYEPEYSFDTDFVSGLDEYTDEGHPIRSRYTVTLYFEGEQRELVHRWQTQGTWDTIYNNGTSWMGHGQKLEHQYSDGMDIVEIVARFEKKPTSLLLTPEKEEVSAGEIIDIELSEFTDEFGEPSREFNRLVVHAFAGEIMNGNKCDIGPDYKVFRVDAGINIIKYRAPDNCEESEDRITVYSSCDILPVSRVPLSKTQIYTRLEEREIDIKCDYEWSGTMTVEKIEKFDCQLDKSTDDSWGRTKLHELSTTRATVSILAENIDDSPPGFNINMGENLTVSGFMKCEYNNTEIRDGRKSGVNPSSGHHKETLVGEDLFDLTHKNLNLLFTSNMEDLQKDGSLEELAKMLESGEMDQAKLEEFGKKFEESMGTGEAGKSKITVFLTIFGDCMCKATLSQNGWTVKNGERTTINESENFDLEIGGGVALEFTADYVRNKDGSATITGNYNKTTPIPGGQREGCPPREETITCTLNLSKRPK